MEYFFFCFVNAESVYSAIGDGEQKVTLILKK